MCDVYVYVVCSVGDVCYVYLCVYDCVCGYNMNVLG